jgi:hypothetical protein
MSLNDATTLLFSGPLTTAQPLVATATVSADQTDTNTANNTASGTSQANHPFVPSPTNVGDGGTPSGGGGGGGGGGAFDPAAALAILSAILLRRPRRVRGLAQQDC